MAERNAGSMYKQALLGDPTSAPVLFNRGGALCQTKPFLDAQSENKWGFGQVAAWALLVPVIIKECGAWVSKYATMCFVRVEMIWDPETDENNRL